MSAFERTFEIASRVVLVTVASIVLLSRQLENDMPPAHFGHFRWSHDPADQCVRLPAWGFLLVFHSFQLGRGTDRRTDGS